MTDYGEFTTADEAPVGAASTSVNSGTGGQTPSNSRCSHRREAIEGTFSEARLAEKSGCAALRLELRTWWYQGKIEFV